MSLPLQATRSPSPACLALPCPLCLARNSAARTRTRSLRAATPLVRLRLMTANNGSSHAKCPEMSWNFITSELARGRRAAALFFFQLLRGTATKLLMRASEACDPDPILEARGFISSYSSTIFFSVFARVSPNTANNRLHTVLVRRGVPFEGYPSHRAASRQPAGSERATTPQTLQHATPYGHP